MCEAKTETLKPANIVWRIFQGLIDDLIVTFIALLVAWAAGVLPYKVELPDFNKGFSSVVEMAQRYLPLTAQLGATLFIYVAFKFIYYVVFVAWSGRTPACYMLRLRIVMSDGGAVSLSGSLKRAIAGGVISHTPVVGHILRFVDYLATLFNGRKQAVRDMVANTMLVHM
jgi:uncharacterized RDD family membrane protein YckC